MKKFSAFLVLIFICKALVSQGQFSGGSGTADDPYQVATLEQLQEVRHQIGEGGYSAFRVPALVVSNEGTLIAVAEARYATWRDDFAEDDIVIKRSEDGGKTWGEPHGIDPGIRKTGVSEIQPRWGTFVQ